MTNKELLNSVQIDVVYRYQQPDGTIIEWDPVNAKLHPEFYGIADKKVQDEYGQIKCSIGQIKYIIG